MENLVSTNYPLIYAPHFPHVIHMLELLPRTGWLQWNIDKPENVWEHILSTRDLAIEYKDQLKLSEEEFVDLLNMIEIHDWAEAIAGDEVILGDERNVDELRAKKKTRELEAIEKLCSNHPVGNEVLSLYKRYSNGSDHIAKLVKQLEKLQAVFKAAEYEKKYSKTGLTDEFIHYTHDLINDSFLRSEFEKIATCILLVIMATDVFFASAI